MYRAITYVGTGKKSGIIVRMGKQIYDFEWQKSLGIGNATNEVLLKHAITLAKWKEGGKRMFFLEK